MIIAILKTEKNERRIRKERANFVLGYDTERVAKVDGRITGDQMFNSQVVKLDIVKAATGSTS